MGEMNSSSRDKKLNLRIVVSLVVVLIAAPKLYAVLVEGSHAAKGTNQIPQFIIFLCLLVAIGVWVLGLILEFLDSVKSNPGMRSASLALMGWKESALKHKRAILIAIASVVLISAGAMFFRYDVGGIGNVVFRYDRFSRVVYMRTMNYPEWRKTDFVNLQHAIETVKMSEERRN